jgi:hypothetical protein
MDMLIRFPIFVLVSFVVFSALVYFVLRRRQTPPARHQVLAVGAVVVVGGMLFAKAGQNLGWPWWIYYTLPMLVTVFLPPLFFRMSRREVPLYLVLSYLSAPAIHVLFSFLLGWKEYMPFIPVPWLWELVV